VLSLRESKVGSLNLTQLAYNAFPAAEAPLTNRRFALLLAVTLGVVGAALGQATTAQPPSKAAPNPFLRLAGNGVWWASLADDTKDTFIDGYVTAMIRVNHMVAAQCADGMKNLHPGAQFDAEMTTAMALCVTAEFFDFSIDERLDRQKVRNGVDDFYKDSQNSRIPIDYAMAYVKDTLTCFIREGDASEGWCRNFKAKALVAA
jgi:hypothetical protein